MKTRKLEKARAAGKPLWQCGYPECGKFFLNQASHDCHVTDKHQGRGTAKGTNKGSGKHHTAYQHRPIVTPATATTSTEIRPPVAQHVPEPKPEPAFLVDFVTPHTADCTACNIMPALPVSGLCTLCDPVVQHASSIIAALNKFPVMGKPPTAETSTTATQALDDLIAEQAINPSSEQPRTYSQIADQLDSYNTRMRRAAGHGAAQAPHSNVLHLPARGPKASPPSPSVADDPDNDLPAVDHWGDENPLPEFLLRQQRDPSIAARTAQEAFDYDGPMVG